MTATDIIGSLSFAFVVLILLVLKDIQTELRTICRELKRKDGDTMKDDRLISLNAAIDALGQCAKRCVNIMDSYHIDIEDAEARIRRVPSARQWIPCSERMPEEEEKEYLVTILDREDDVREVYKGFYMDGKWWTQWCHGCLEVNKEPCGDNIVVAWMPLPKPWKGEQDES